MTFQEHLDRATETVRKWPFWKRTILGPATPEDLQAVRENQKRQDQKEVE